MTDEIVRRSWEHFFGRKKDSGCLLSAMPPSDGGDAASLHVPLEAIEALILDKGYRVISLSLDEVRYLKEAINAYLEWREMLKAGHASEGRLG